MSEALRQQPALCLYQSHMSAEMSQTIKREMNTASEHSNVHVTI